MKSDIADILSLSRMVGSVLLLFTAPMSVPFLLIYGYCCVSDVLDGRLARCRGSESKSGQILDSTADIILTVCLLASLIPFLPWEPWMITWIAIIAVVRIASLGIGVARFGEIALLHTYGNKISAFLRYLAPYMILLIGLDVTIIIACVVTTASAAEDLGINMTSDHLDRNVRSIFCHKSVVDDVSNKGFV